MGVFYKHKDSHLIMAHHPEPNDQVDTEEEGDGVVALGHILLHVTLKSTSFE